MKPPYGWAVFPVRMQGKAPLTEHGYKDATTDPDAIAEWAARWPGCNWGTPTPLVLDVDPRSGGLESLSEWEAKNGPLPEGPRSKTGGGGFHYFFLPPEDGAQWNGPIPEYPGLDLKGAGRGYVVIPPSKTDAPYEWMRGTEDLELPQAPERLLTLARGRPRSTSTGERRSFNGEVSAYGRAALDRELEWVRTAPGGRRNAQLNRAAFCLGQLHAGGELPDVRSDLLDAARASGLLDDPKDGERQTRQTIESGWAAGTANPRAKPEEAAPKLVAADPMPDEFEAEGITESALNDVANGKRLVRQRGQDMRYCAPWGRWLLWDGARWREDDRCTVEAWAKETVRSIYLEASTAEASADQKALAKHAVTSGNAARLSAMVDAARSEPGIPIVPDQLDAHPWLLACPNGTLDLLSGRFHPARRDDLLSRCTGVPYDESADCPRWERFLREVLPDQETRDFLQRAAGYSLTGSTSEQCMFIAWGAGANGKSTLIETLLRIVGDYSMRAPTEMLLGRKGDAIPNDIAQLKGRRFVAAAETDTGRRFSEGIIKQLTGSDTISARFMRGEFFEFSPICKLWLSTNHKPVIRGTDEGIWRRIRLIPFEQTFPPEARDPELPADLAKELSGIFTWMVRGCSLWLEKGLEAPEKVSAATGEYRREMDNIADFLDECTIDDDRATVSSRAIYRAYTKWCEESGERALSQKKLGEALREKGYRDGRTKDGRFWGGLRLIVENHPLPSWNQMDDPF
ncbi:MAG: bifunctional DNA primase/polymerase [Candidatus Eisenbacteria bacterium]|uniref:Bifunctional DNA primase/polymerase n=1 Tax=Eiseniibacteriota bacterium TaxID=2212470 RepID=A0A956LXC9_UNCEI|nr:bifunctional DNA primase/polymerase [Candidatus Eisenbacteria bacterium]